MLKKLRELKKAAVDAMGEILALAETEDRDLTEAEATKFDELKAEVATLDTKIERATTLESHQASVAQVTPAAAASAGINQVVYAGGDPAKKEFESIGEFMAAVVNNPNDQRLSNLYHDLPNADQNMGTGSAGGFAVPTQFRDTLMKVDPKSAVIRPRATVIPAGSPPDAAITMPALSQGGDQNVHGGVEVTWTAGGEGGTAAETEAVLKDITLEPQELSAIVPITNKLLRNWGAASSVVETLMRQSMISAEESAFFAGNGIGKPRGFLGSAAQLTVARATADRIKYADVANMLGQIWDMNGAVFMYNQRSLPQLMQLEDTAGNLIWANATSGSPATLMGLPAVMAPFAPALGTEGDLTLASLNNYLIKDGSGPIVSASEHAEFRTSKTLIKLIWNVDGQPWLNAPIKDQAGNTFSPFVALTDAE